MVDLEVELAWKSVVRKSGIHEKARNLILSYFPGLFIVNRAR